MIVVADSVSVAALRAMVDRCKLIHLFSNDVAVSPGVRAAQFKELSGFGGYKPVSVQPFDVTPKSARGGVHEFYFPTAVKEPIAGWYITDADGAFVCGERFEKALDFSAYGGRIKIQPVLKLRETSV